MEGDKKLFRYKGRFVAKHQLLRKSNVGRTAKRHTINPEEYVAVNTPGLKHQQPGKVLPSFSSSEFTCLFTDINLFIFFYQIKVK